MSGVIVTIGDVRRAGFCAAGIRRHCEAHGLDFRRLTGPGIPADEVRGIDDAWIARAVRTAEERANGDGR